MFTGLVTDVGVVERIEPGAQRHRVRIASSYRADSIATGASIACGGPCLTALDIVPTAGGCSFAVDVGAETLARTTAGAWREGMRLNLERSLKVGDELGGHIVTGHIDAVATVRSVDAFDGMSRFAIAVPSSVLLIPHTLAVTTWGERKAGDGLNLEVDLMARYAARLTERGEPAVSR